MKYKVICKYDGSNYSGFQSQINAPSVQDEIERCLSIFLKEPVKILLCSRTDAKVHALGQVFQFRYEQDINRDAFIYNLNNLLNDDIRFIDIEQVAEDFHCRKNIEYKHYRYLIDTDKNDVFMRNYAYLCPYRLDFDKLVEGSKIFIGKHDFTSYNATPIDLIPDQVREIYKIDIRKEDDLIIIDYYGDGFLRYMIRLITGMLIEYARGHYELDYLKKMLDEPSKDYNRYNVTGAGLYLVEVVYKQ